MRVDHLSVEKEKRKEAITSNRAGTKEGENKQAKMEQPLHPNGKGPKLDWHSWSIDPVAGVTSHQQTSSSWLWKP